MENIKEYKFKSKYFNNFFWQNNFFFVKAEKCKNKLTCTEIKYKNKKYYAIIIDSKIKNIKENKKVRELAYSIIDNIKKPDYLYTDIRLNFPTTNSVITISKRIGIEMKPIDINLKYALIVYNYFKLKEIIEKQGYDTFYEQYKVAGINETITQTFKRSKGSINDYFFIVTLKNIIRIYKKEIDSEIDCDAPLFNDKMLLKYLNNYFSKMAIIDYDKEKVKDFISNYYITENQSEDMTRLFIENFLSFYQIITDNKFSYENSYEFNLKQQSLYNNKKASNIKKSNFYKYFDNIMEIEKNYYNFMFMLEILDFSSATSEKKSIINYISILELMLVKGDKNISFQIQNKCKELIKNNKFSETEIKLAYDYRSKIIHGEYEETIIKLRQLSLLDAYKFTKKEMEYEIYLNFDQMLEQRLCERLCMILTIVLRYFIFKNNLINTLKLK